MHPYVHCSVIYNSQDTEATQGPIHRQEDKKVAVHILFHSYVEVNEQNKLTNKVEADLTQSRLTAVRGERGSGFG